MPSINTLIPKLRKKNKTPTRIMRNLTRERLPEPLNTKRRQSEIKSKIRRTRGMGKGMKGRRYYKYSILREAVPTITILKVISSFKLRKAYRSNLPRKRMISKYKSRLTKKIFGA